MNVEQLEKRLEEKIADYDHEIERLKAVTAVQNLMAAYESVHITPEEIWKTSELFALWRPDCSVEVSLQGCIVGPDNIREYWSNMKAYSIKGAAFWHAVTTPLVQVAGNGMTAKAIFKSPGFECGMELQKGRPPFNTWCFGNYAMDFIKNPETGEWKIWHMHWYRQTRNDYDKNFIDFAQYEHDNPPKLRPKEGNYEVHPTVFHRCLSVTEDTHPFPCAPQPYYDYDGDFNSWQYGDEAMQKRYGVEVPDYRKLYNANYPERV